MPATFLIASELLLLTLYAFLAAIHHATRRAREAELLRYHPRSFQGRIKRWLVGGTDSDLRLEIAYFTLLATVAILAAEVGAKRATFDGVHAVVGVALGFHIRQWLAKWRMRNIVFAKILLKQRLLYFKSTADTLAFVANLILTLYLVSSHGGYVFCAFCGFFVQDLTLESSKAARLLRRKLHIFDLDGLPVPEDKKTALFEAVRQHSTRSLRALVRSADTPRDRLLLHGFTLLLHDDFENFRQLLASESATIEGDSDLLFYFGKALYALGDIDGARKYLDRGCSLRHRDRLCMAYFALTLISDSRDGGVRAALEILEQCYQSPGSTKGDMFALAFYALALALSSNKLPAGEARRVCSEKAFWCINEALRLNETFADRNNLGSLQQHYFLGNEQMLLDIYGYLLYTTESYILAFRVLEDSIRQDDTYPWPYFHLALIYSSLGRFDLARVIYSRVALHERSDTVLRRLCIRRLGRLLGDP